MNCVVTAGPTCEPLDEVRRLTNSSTGRLGSELANHLVEQGHEVTLLLGAGATHPGPWRAQRCDRFTSTADLETRLARLAGSSVQAVFHAAAVSDFRFGKIWKRMPDGTSNEIRSAKVSSRESALLAELVATPKIIGQLRGWFPRARLVGWKLELDGARSEAIARAARQIVEHGTDACVVNGRAYGAGFGWVSGPGDCRHLADVPALYAALSEWLTA